MRPIAWFSLVEPPSAPPAWGKQGRDDRRRQFARMNCPVREVSHGVARPAAAACASQSAPSHVIVLASSMADSSELLNVASMVPVVVYVASGSPSPLDSSGHWAAVINSVVQLAAVPSKVQRIGSAVHAALSSSNPSSVRVRSHNVASSVAVGSVASALQVSVWYSLPSHRHSPAVGVKAVAPVSSLSPLQAVVKVSSVNRIHWYDYYTKDS